MLRVSHGAAGDGCGGKEQPPKERQAAWLVFPGAVQKMCGTVTFMWSAISVEFIFIMEIIDCSRLYCSLFIL